MKGCWLGMARLPREFVTEIPPFNSVLKVLYHLGFKRFAAKIVCKTTSSKIVPGSRGLFLQVGLAKPELKLHPLDYRFADYF